MSFFVFSSKKQLRRRGRGRVVCIRIVFFVLVGQFGFLRFSNALVLPPVPTVTAVVGPNASGWSKIQALARSLADVVCLAGQYQANKYFPLNVRYQGNVSAFGVKITAGCSPFDSYVYDSYSGAGNWQSQTWGSGTRYYETGSYREDCSSPLVGLTASLTTMIAYAPYGLGGGWTAGVPSGPTVRITGRKYFREECTSGCSTFCAPTSACAVCVWSTLYSSTGSLEIATTNEFSGSIYLPNQGPWPALAVAAGDFSAFGEQTGSTWPVAGGTITDLYAYNDYVSAGALDLTDTDVQVSSAGVDISSQVASFFVFSSSTSADFTATNGILQNIYNFVSSTAGVSISSAGGVQNSFEQFQNSISSLPVFGIFENLLPADTTTMWEPCFDFSGLWSSSMGYVVGGSPPAGDQEFCLTEISGWDAFMVIVRFTMILLVFVWGVKYIWGGY